MIGHGYEDLERYIRTKKLGFDIYHSRIGVGYHLWHPRNSEFYNVNDSTNIEEMNKIEYLETKELDIYIYTWTLKNAY